METQILDKQLQEWDLDQKLLSKQLILHMDSPEVLKLRTEENSIVCGIDVAYNTDKTTNKEIAYCSLVFQNYKTYKIEAVVNYKSICNVPYIPSYFSYRELPIISEALNKAESQLGVDYLNKVRLYVFDGNGYLHPRHMGIASQASLCINYLKNKPTIGIAKTFYSFNKQLYHDPLPQIGSYTNIDLINEHGSYEVYGREYRSKQQTSTNSKSSIIFISQGNNITLQSATEVVNHYCLRNKQLPTKLADHETHIFRHS